jgi:hypothetical protein
VGLRRFLFCDDGRFGFVLAVGYFDVKAILGPVTQTVFIILVSGLRIENSRRLVDN